MLWKVGVSELVSSITNFVCLSLAISVTSPGHRFLCLSKGETEAEGIINASVDFMEGLYAALFGLPLWKIYKTPSYKKLEQSHEHIFQ